MRHHVIHVQTWYSTHFLKVGLLVTEHDHIAVLVIKR